MEKCGNKSKPKSCRRLLVFILLIFIIMSKTHSQSQNNEIENFDFFFVPTPNQNFYENEDISFELYLENINSNEIELVSYNLPDNVKLRLFKKMEKNGTVINVWLNFTQSGEFELEDFIFSFSSNEDEPSNSQNFHVKFPEILIAPDLSIQKPEIYICFDDKNTIKLDKETSTEKDNPVIICHKQYDDKFSFTIFVKYAFDILHFDYEIPKNAILTQTNFFEHSKSSLNTENEEYSEQLFPIASFDMVCLQTGKTEFPKISIQLENFQHQKEKIILENYAVEILNYKKNHNIKESKMFDSAFEDLEPQKQQSQNTTLQILSSEEKNLDDCIKLAKELKSKHQKKVLKIFGITFILLISLLLLFLKKIKHKKSSLAIFSIFFVILILIFIILFLNDKNAVFLGGTVHSIPNEKSAEKTYINAGTPIKIIKNSGIWSFIEFTEETEDSINHKKTGWCKKECISSNLPSQ